MHGLTERHKNKRKNDPDGNGRYAKILDQATLAAGVIGPLMTVPQLLKIYYYHQAAGVSAISWFAFAALDIPFLMYGFYHREKPIIITYALWFFANFAVAAGALMFNSR